MSATILRCPLCDGRLEVVSCTTVREYARGYQVRGEPLPEHEMPTTVVSCSGCEFVVDLEYSDRLLRGEESLTLEIALLVRQAQEVRQ